MAQTTAIAPFGRMMLGRTTGNVVAIKSMKDSVIANFTVTEKMLT
jgi:actin-like ATPase involved in cell morphogenesis